MYSTVVLKHSHSIMMYAMNSIVVLFDPRLAANDVYLQCSYVPGSEQINHPVELTRAIMHAWIGVCRVRSTARAMCTVGSWSPESGRGK